MYSSMKLMMIERGRITIFYKTGNYFSLIFLHSEKNIHHTRKKKKIKNFIKENIFYDIYHRQSASSTKPGKYYQSTCRLSLLHN